MGFEKEVNSVLPLDATLSHFYLGFRNFIMKIHHILIGLLTLRFISCQQKKLILEIKALEPQEFRIYFDKEGYPKLNSDKDGNVTVKFDSLRTFFTSSKFGEIKNLRSVFCIDDNDICLADDNEWEPLGFSINEYSHFTSDTTKSKAYVNPYQVFIIARINR